MLAVLVPVFARLRKSRLTGAKSPKQLRHGWPVHFALGEQPLGGGEVGRRRVEDGLAPPPPVVIEQAGQLTRRAPARPRQVREDPRVAAVDRTAACVAADREACRTPSPRRRPRSSRKQVGEARDVAHVPGGATEERRREAVVDGQRLGDPADRPEPHERALDRMLHRRGPEPVAERRLDTLDRLGDVDRSSTASRGRSGREPG